MSGELPKEADVEISGKIFALERRLQRAKDAKEQYLGELREDHPDVFRTRTRLTEKLAEGDSRPRMPQRAREVPSMFEGFSRPSLLGRLETSAYFWDHLRVEESAKSKVLDVANPIPSTFVLSSDMKNLKERLQEIGNEVRTLRQTGLSAPTDVYFQTLSAANQPSAGYYDDPKKADLPSMAEIRSRILNMQINVEKRARELISDADEKCRTMRQKVSDGPDFDLETKKWAKELQTLPVNVEESKTATTVPAASVSKDDHPATSSAPLRPTPPEVEVPKPTMSSPQPLIVPQRTLNFSSFLQNEPKKAATESASYARMLNILRPAAESAAIHSDSSSSADEPIPNKTSKDENPTISGFLEQLSAPKPVETTLRIQKPKPDSDSDSEFFK